MRKSDYGNGLPAVLNGTAESEEQLQQRARNEVARKLGIDPRLMAEQKNKGSADHAQDYYVPRTSEHLYINIPETKSAESKDKFGNTAAQKKRMIDKQITRPKIPMHVQLQNLKEWAQPGLKEEIHPAEKHYEDELNRIEKRGKSWFVKHLKKEVPTKKPYFFDTKEGIDHATKIMREEASSPNERANVDKLNRNMKRSALNHHVKTLKPYSHHDRESYPSDPVQGGKLLEMDKLEKDLAVSAKAGFKRV